MAGEDREAAAEAEEEWVAREGQTSPGRAVVSVLEAFRSRNPARDPGGKGLSRLVPLAGAALAHPWLAPNEN